jgi:hypothetical protein
MVLRPGLTRPVKNKPLTWSFLQGRPSPNDIRTRRCCEFDSRLTDIRQEGRDLKHPRYFRG